MTDVFISAADYRAWAAGTFLLGAVMFIGGAVVLIRSRRGRRCCGTRIRRCPTCGRGRCWRCDPYGSQPCDRREVTS